MDITKFHETNMIFRMRFCIDENQESTLNNQFLLTVAYIPLKTVNYKKNLFSLCLYFANSYVFQQFVIKFFYGINKYQKKIAPN